MSADRRNSQFGYRGTFACGCCSRMTRQVRGIGNETCCPDCFELAGIENSLSDGINEPDEVRKEVAYLWEKIVHRGGNIEQMRRNFSSEIVNLI